MDWIEGFRKVFDAIQDEFAIVLHATGCREKWLQGELFHRLRQQDSAFEVDFKFVKKPRFDLYGEQGGQMIGEIKVAGQRGYDKKHIVGNSPIKPFLPDRANGRIIVTAAHLERVNGNSLLKDYIRLNAADDDFKKYLLLVIHKNGHANNTGRAALAIKFPGDEAEFDYPGFLVRIWSV